MAPGDRLSARPGELLVWAPSAVKAVAGSSARPAVAAKLARVMTWLSWWPAISASGTTAGDRLAVHRSRQAGTVRWWIAGRERRLDPGRAQRPRTTPRSVWPGQTSHSPATFHGSDASAFRSPTGLDICRAGGETHRLPTKLKLPCRLLIFAEAADVAQATIDWPLDEAEVAARRYALLRLACSPPVPVRARRRQPARTAGAGQLASTACSTASRPPARRIGCAGHHCAMPEMPAPCVSLLGFQQRCRRPLFPVSTAHRSCCDEPSFSEVQEAWTPSHRQLGAFVAAVLGAIPNMVGRRELQYL